MSIWTNLATKFKGDPLRPLLFHMSDPTTPPSKPPATGLLINPATVIGPIFVGNTVNWLLLGVLAMQVYTYGSKYPKDKVTIKVLVYVMFVLDVMQTVFGMHEAWWYSIQIWGNIPALQGAPWTATMVPVFCGLISAMVQSFYAFRIWILKRNLVPRLLAGFILLLALAQSLSAIIASSLLLQSLTQENLRRLHPLFTMWLAGSFVTDILIAGSMIWILHGAKSGTSISRTDSLLDRLIVNTVSTGAVTAISAGIDLALFVKYTQVNYHFAFAYVLGKLYSNSFMATLNSRRSQAQISDNPESFGMRIQVSQQTQRTGGTKIASQENTTGNWETTMGSIHAEDNQRKGLPGDLTHAVALSSYDGSV
ncbi:hypothetical protein C8J57DRAFT_1724350 [Mycena rebaudengoi]|nr:hypothetical protein C8J57DRAFT_1724350 [Mycena rebaudengoi]